MAKRSLMDFINSLSISTQGMAAFAAFFGTLAVGTIGFHYIEEDWSWIDSFYFCTYTLTTVGYGDIVPTTDAGRLCASLYMIVGVTIALAALAVVGSNYIRHREIKMIDRITEMVASRSERLGHARGEKKDPDDDDLEDEEFPRLK